MNKKGSVMVESVLVFPVTIMSIAALLFMMTYFYLQLDKRVDMHMQLRCESGNITATIIYDNKPESQFPVYKKMQQIHSSGVAESSDFLFLSGRTKSIEARKYLIDEAEFVRISGILKNERQVH